MDLTVRSNLPAPGEVDAAKAGCGHATWQLRGEDGWSSSANRWRISMSETPQQQLAIEALVRGRCQELGLRPVELVRRCGYQNLSKGLRRLEELRAGDFARTTGLVRALPTALEVPVDAVREAVEKTERYLHESLRRLGGRQVVKNSSGKYEAETSSGPRSASLWFQWRPRLRNSTGGRFVRPTAVGLTPIPYGLKLRKKFLRRNVRVGAIQLGSRVTI